MLLLASQLAAATPERSVIDRATLERYRFPSVARALEMLAGIDVTRTYFKQNIVTSRGILEEHYANKILFMIDGVPAWNAVTGEPNVDRIDINDVERIEVTKGPSTVTYGTNAYTAAINVVLRADAAGSYAARASAGTRSSGALGAHATFATGGGTLFVAANGSRDGGAPRSILAERNVIARYDEYQRGSDVTLRFATPRQRLLVNAAEDHESFLGNTPDVAGGLGHDHRSRNLLGAYEVALPASLRFRVAYDRSHRNFSRSADDRTRSNVDGWRLTNTLSAALKPAPAWRVDAALEHELRRSQQYTNYDVTTGRVLEDNGMHEHSLREWSLAARTAYDAGRWHLGAGGRFTTNALSHGHASVEGSAALDLGAANSVAVRIAQSTRPPSFFELYFHTSTNTVFGNTALEPESATSFELSDAFRRGALEAKATLYHADYDDKIFRTRRLPNDPVDRSLVYVNGNRFSANGLEVESRYALDRVALFATYAYVDGTSGDALPGTTHSNFRYVPKHAASGGVSFDHGAWSFAAAGTWRSSTHGPLAGVAAHGSVDLFAGWSMRAGRVDVRHGLAVSNATDSRDDVPEFVRRNINAVPSGVGRRISYELTIRSPRPAP